MIHTCKRFSLGILGVAAVAIAIHHSLNAASSPATEVLSTFGAAGTNHARGLVPITRTNAAATELFLREDATWANIGEKVTGVSGLALVTTNYVAVTINGALVKLAIVQ